MADNAEPSAEHGQSAGTANALPDTPSAAALAAAMRASQQAVQSASLRIQQVLREAQTSLARTMSHVADASGSGPVRTDAMVQQALADVEAAMRESATSVKAATATMSGSSTSGD